MRISALRFFLLLLVPSAIQAQVSDTIFTFKNKIVCDVHEVGLDLVKYSYPKEEVINVLPKSQVNRIVYKNGREQIVNPQHLLKSVSYIVDWSNVTVTNNENDLSGLEKRKELNAIIRSKTLEMSYETAIEILKKKAAMRGYNAVLVNFDAISYNETRYGGYVSSQIIGEAYTEHKSIPSLEDFKLKIGNASKFKILNQYSLSFNMLISEIVSGHFKLQRTSVENGRVFLFGNMGGLMVDSFRLVYLGPSFFVVHFEGVGFEYEYELSYE